MKKIILLFPIFLLTVFIAYFLTHPLGSFPQKIISTPTPFNPYPYHSPIIPNKHAYLTLLVGDSMVAALGPSANSLRLELLKLYPTHEFVNYNRAVPATNVLTLTSVINENLDDGFDLVIIGSFAYNPLSHLPLDQGLKAQTKALDTTIKTLIQKRPEVVIVMITPIAPNKYTFAQKTYALAPEVRAAWVTERIAYINNHIKFAKDHQIPLVNIYETSLNENGDGNPIYISSDDYIHPSNAGIELMSREIAQFIFDNQIFPN